jgi:drug/metabolite transporter (DMT)-like permease
VAGAAIALGGVYVITDPAGGGFGMAEVLTLGCAAAFSVQIQLTNVVTRRSSPEAVTLVMFVFAVLFSSASFGGAGGSWSGLARSLGVRAVAGNIAYTAVACTVVAITVMNRFQREIPATRAAVLYTLEPVFAAIFSAAFAGEEMGVRKVLGGAIIVGGNLVCELFRRGGSEARS